jgi:AraC-like DNA-binding protein
MTTLIKKTSGRSAMDWINDYVIMEAKNLLRYSEMSIQEISEYLNFSNQSFFAQYFKRVTGCSPSDYRDRPQV